MGDFPAFMKNPLNRIDRASQYTDDTEGYLFEGADGGQVAFWTSAGNGVSEEHVNDFDEYVFVIEGRCTFVISGKRTDLLGGDEFIVRKGTKHSMAVVAGTRTVHVFGGKRALRESESEP